MKKALVFTLICALLLCGLPRTASASEEVLLYEEPSFRPDEAPKTWEITPSDTGEYILFAADCLSAEIVGVTGAADPAMTHGVVYTLAAGQTYTVQIGLNPAYASQYPDGYKDVVCVQKKLPLQRIYFMEEAITAMQYDFAGFQVFAEPAYYKVENLTWAVSDSAKAEITDTYDNCAGVRLLQQGSVTVTASMAGKTAQCLITVEAMAGGDWESYPLWPAGQTRYEVTASAGMGAQLRYVPETSGWYAFYNETNGIHGDIRHASPAVNVPTKTAHTSSKNVTLYQLNAGETYIVGVGVDHPDSPAVTGTMVLEPAKSAEKVELFGPEMVSGSTIIGYVGGMQDLFARTDPEYSYILTSDDFEFISSDPTMVDLGRPGFTGDPARNIILLKPGSCTITVRGGGKEAVCEVTVLEPPVLELNKTETLQHDGYAVGVLLQFTPGESGYYTFTASGAGGTCAIQDTDIGMYFYDRTASMSGWLEGGKTYLIDLFVAGSVHTITVTEGDNGDSNNGGGGGDEPTEDPTEPSFVIKPGQPTRPTEAPTEPAPTEGTAPTQPSEQTPTQPAPADCIPAQVADGKASVTVEQLEKALEIVKPGQLLEIDANKFGVTAFQLSKQSLTRITAAGVQLQIDLPTAKIILDSAALTAIETQAGEEVSLQCSIASVSVLSQAQRQALEKLTVDGVVQLELKSGENQIHDFKGGMATVQLQRSGEAVMQVYYLSPEGALEQVSSGEVNGLLTFQTGHFSDYVLVRGQIAADPMPMILAIAAAVLAVGGIVVLVLLRMQAAKKKR